MKQLTAESLARVIEESDLLPPLPETILLAHNINNNPDYSIAQIASFLKNDPVVSFKVLKLANSAYYGMRTRIDSIETALIVLGLKTVSQILYAVGTMSAFSKGTSRGFLKVMARRSVIVAALSSLLSRMLGFNFYGVEYTAGLLHDLGHAVIDACFPEHAQYLRTHGDPLTMGCEMEKELIGIDHTLAGGMLAESWYLPKTIAECMQSHHLSIDQDADVSIPGIVRFSVYLADYILGPDGQIHEFHDAIPTKHFASVLTGETIISNLRENSGNITSMEDIFLPD